jgi:glycosyltransferase involved in cell wall biosynthesis
LFSAALSKAIGTANPTRFDSGDVKFIFYASQFRPNKNVLSLLRAYDHLRKQRYIAHKLILTGIIWRRNVVDDYISLLNQISNRPHLKAERV